MDKKKDEGYLEQNNQESSAVLKSKARESEVSLVPGKKENYWHIYYIDNRAGHVVIEKKSKETFPLITVMLNKKNQGKGIGTIAFRRACELSTYQIIYANISKKNIASLVAAERAGFKIVKISRSGQLVLRWRGKSDKNG
ncbi:GNAT family N-acetyltransferase [Paenibacillus planticolens]|uniref:GNAT family N-acetyltransferase n=1 Tax=Paenibacillus planticolens TaxID=2654976 RepID=A0ABX1ZKU3_9BACL|nr:GNAT family protein [Paenibacillus planticolens]NOU99481.1 GNAT family N-acetyltransferase [Paenibacillus planticolens]